MIKANTRFSAIVIVLVFLICFIPHPSKAGEAKFIWFDDSGTGRQQYGVFQRSFEIKQKISNAWICLFADTRYQLFINGNYINFGPIRFYSQHPCYDSINMAPYLRIGLNLISVRVLSNGIETFQHERNIGGFIAWGKVLNKNTETENFKTPGKWICKRDKGFDESSPRVSFALPIIESYNANQGLHDWENKELPDGTAAVVLKNQKAWGELKPRSIPFMNHEEVLPKSLLGIYSLKADEDIYSFRIKTADTTRDAYNENPWAFAYTYIYSPTVQKVPVGMWWGEFWLNDEGPIQGKGFDQVRPHRSDIVLDLKEGWNFFFIKYGIVWAYWDFYMAIPSDANLSLSPDKKMNTEICFRSAGTFTFAEDSLVKNLPLPFKSPDDLPELSAGWIDRPKNYTAGNPAWEVAWSYFDKKIDNDPTQISDITVSDTNGNALVYDFGYTQMGNFFIEFTAPHGTIIDVAFTEDTLGNRPYILKRAELMLATRYIAKEGENHFLTFNPYGAKFVQINIKGNEGKPVHIKRTGMINQLYPFEKTGSFECSDPMLNDIWELGYRTLRVCSEDSYTDTPVRERTLYAGDAFPEYAITLATSGDSRLIRRSLELFQDMYKNIFSDTSIFGYRSSLSDFPMLTTLYLEWYLNRTGDIEFIKKVYPAYRNMIIAIDNNKDSLGLIKTSRIFIEWTEMQKNNYSSTAFNAITAACCYAMARMAVNLGNMEDASLFTKKGDDLKQIILLKCWDAQTGAFCDGYKDGKKIPSFYPISSNMLSLFGFTTAEQEKRLTAYYTRLFTDIGSRDREGLATPYGAFYALGSLYRTENAGLAEKYMRNYWGPMVLKYNNNVWENFSADGAQGTMSHAWSGSPTFYLTTQCLGIRLGFPEIMADINDLYIMPQAETVNWAKGSVPHPHGTIYVEWRIKGNVMYLNYKVPEGLKVSVQPKGRLALLKLIVNSEPIIVP